MIGKRGKRMKKPYKHTELSDKRCIKCGKRLKKNLLVKKPNAVKCYKCWKGEENGNGL